MKLALLLWAAFAAWGQGPVFEVASVKPTEGLREGSTIRNNPGRFETENVTLS
jgi:hypothetical protein